MLAKPAQSVAPLLTVLFTSLIAPVIVNFIVQGINNSSRASDTSAPRLRAEPPAPPATVLPCSRHATSSPPSPAAAPHAVPRMPVSDPLLRLLVEGTGATPEQATQDALRRGLARALATRVDATVWQQHGPVLVERAWRDVDRLVRSWREVQLRRTGQAGTLAHRTTLALDLDPQAISALLGGTPTALTAAPVASLNPPGIVPR